jgi:hypothetical protein
MNTHSMLADRISRGGRLSASIQKQSFFSFAWHAQVLLILAAELLTVARVCNAVAIPICMKDNSSGNNSNNNSNKSI